MKTICLKCNTEKDQPQGKEFGWYDHTRHGIIVVDFCPKCNTETGQKIDQRINMNAETKINPQL